MRWFFGKLKTPKSPSEINQPLVGFYSIDEFNDQFVGWKFPKFSLLHEVAKIHTPCSLQCLEIIVLGLLERTCNLVFPFFSVKVRPTRSSVSWNHFPIEEILIFAPIQQVYLVFQDHVLLWIS